MLTSDLCTTHTGAQRQTDSQSDRQRCTTTESDKGRQKISELQRDGTGGEIAKPRELQGTYVQAFFRESILKTEEESKLIHCLNHDYHINILSNRL